MCSALDTSCFHFINIWISNSFLPLHTISQVIREIKKTHLIFSFIFLIFYGITGKKKQQYFKIVVTFTVKKVEDATLKKKHKPTYMVHFAAFNGKYVQVYYTCFQVLSYITFMTGLFMARRTRKNLTV